MKIKRFVAADMRTALRMVRAEHGPDAVILSNRRAQTAPPFIPSQVGSGLPDWTVIAAGTFLFLLPVAIFTFLLRNHLLRGMSFGAIRK